MLASVQCHSCTQRCPPDCNLSTLTVNKNSTLVHTGIMMDMGDTQETEQSHFDSQPSKGSSTGSRFPYKWGAIVPNLFSVQDSNCSPSLAYIWVSSWSTHMMLIYLMDIWQKMFSLNRFLIIQMYLSGVPPSLPKKPPRERRGHCFWQIFDGDNRGSLSKTITRKTNIFVGEKIYAYFYFYFYFFFFWCVFL